jgi:O-antigen ligase
LQKTVKIKKAKQSNTHKPVYNMKNLLVSLFLYVFFIAFPLFMSNWFFDIRHDKYILTLVCIGSLGLILLFYHLAQTVSNCTKPLPKTKTDAQGFLQTRQQNFAKLFLGIGTVVCTAAGVITFVAGVYSVSNITRFPNDSLGDIVVKLADELPAVLVAFCIFFGLALVGAVFYFYLYFSIKQRQGKTVRTVLTNKFSTTDVGVIAFFAVSLISTLLSQNFIFSFDGTAGRNNGLILIFAYLVIYFIISRNFYFSHGPFLAFAGVSVIVCLLALLNYFYIDPLGTYANLSEEDVDRFITTIGNKNLFSAFICVAMPLCAVMYLMAKQIAARLVYLFAVGWCMIGLIVADSYSGYIALVVLLVCCLVYALKNPVRLQRFLVLCSVILLSGKLLYVLTLIFKQEKEVESFSKVFFSGNISTAFLVIGVAGAVALAVMFKKQPNLHEAEFPKIVAKVFCGLVAAGVLVIAALFVNYTFIDTTTPIGSNMEFLRFNDDWGTHRGYYWRRSFDIFLSQDAKGMFFGIGPDNLKTYFNALFGSESMRMYGEITGTAHNEFLDYLINIGIFGLAAYLTVIIFSVVRVFRCRKSATVALAFAAVIVCYCSQGVVNIINPIVTPLLFVFIALAENMLRKAENKLCN